MIHKAASLALNCPWIGAKRNAVFFFLPLSLRMFGVDRLLNAEA
jgi:hypothetical protein